MEQIIYDILGIGLGPFNLGLAALCQSLELNSLFMEKADSFNWHPGLLLDDARLQVPFYADLVTPADPCSKFSYIAFLHARQRLFRFAIRNNLYIKRQDYNDYCRWVIGQLSNIRFSYKCENIEFDDAKKYYRVYSNNEVYHAKHIVIGVGTVPCIPGFVKNWLQGPVLHSADYLPKKDMLLQQPDISIIGSGQSAAEIIFDLLKCYKGKLNWFSNADSFFPMDNSKFSLEKTSPDYVDYFYSLPEISKKDILSRQTNLYKGINEGLIDSIYGMLDDAAVPSTRLYPGCELQSIQNGYTLGFQHLGFQQHFDHLASAVILATGYHQLLPSFIGPISHHIQWHTQQRYKVNRNYSIDNNNSIFVQNADLHSHGFNAADLGLGVYRNATIINTILGYTHFKMEQGIAFQQFGMP